MLSHLGFSRNIYFCSENHSFLFSLHGNLFCHLVRGGTVWYDNLNAMEIERKLNFRNCQHKKVHGKLVYVFHKTLFVLDSEKFKLHLDSKSFILIFTSSIYLHSSALRAYGVDVYIVYIIYV